MRLRELVEEDAPLMLEWMHDSDVIAGLPTDFASKTKDDCLAFINSAEKPQELHLAIASEENEYMGTVSLKHIDRESGNAEFAIVVRKAAMGRGYSWYSMVSILDMAFEQLNLQSVYWCVSTDNRRACRFYDKHGFHETCDIPQSILKRYIGVKRLRWYSVLRGDDYRNSALSRGSVAGCRVINIDTIPTLNAGELSFIEGESVFPFEIKRLYYISKVPEGTRRGYHAHRTLKQLMFCPYGKIQLILDDGKKREEITLNDPSIGILIEKPVWREMLWLEGNSVLCVVASEHYSSDDYIRDYDEFMKCAKGR